MVFTEYHLILTLGFIHQYFNKEDDVVDIYRVSPTNSKRLNRLNRIELRKYGYKELFVDYKKSGRELKSFLDNIIKCRPTHFFFFLEELFWMEYLLSSLHNNGCKIILAPDGIKPYNDISRSYKDRFLDKLRYYKYAIKHKLYWPIGTPENYYATSPSIDEVWLENPGAYVNHTNKSIVTFEFPRGLDYLTKLNSAFGFDAKDYSYLENKTIIYFDSDEAYPVFLSRNIWLLKHLKNQHPDYTLYVKLHPTSVGEREKVYNAIGDINYLDSKYPAELYIANCREAIFVSLFSTSMFYYNQSCKYYWVYPLYSDIFKTDGIKVPCKHIELINTKEELEKI